MPNNNHAIEKAIAKYNVSINKNNSESEILWNRYNAMLVFNSLLITAIGFTYQPGIKLPANVIPFLPIAGLISCFMWFIVTLRGFQWIDHWIISARKIESKYLLEKTGEISDLDPINKGNEYRERVVGWPKTQFASFILIILIGSLYLMFLFKL